MQVPTIRDVYRARQTIAPYFQRTPLHYSMGLSEMLDAEVYIKHEEHLPLGAFKSRGGVNLLFNLSEEEKRRGLITSSTGNHGQSLASAGREFGARVLIGLPENANPVKVAAMRSLGAELIFHGETFDDARDYCERLAREEGYRYVHAVNEPHLIAGVGTASLEIIEDLPDVDVIMLPLGGGSGIAVNEPHLIAGVGTASLEIIEDLPDVDVIMLPLGGGSGIAGACIVAKAIDSGIQVIAVQSEAAPAAYLSWKQGELVDAPMETFAEGVATKSGYELPQRIMRGMLDDFLLVSDDDIRRAIGLLVEKAHTLAEPAGATALAGAVKHANSLKGKKVSVTISGANITADRLAEALKVYQESER